MKLIGFAFLVFVLFFVPYDSFAQQDQYEILGQTLTHDPTICALEPKTEIPDTWKKLSKYTGTAVSDWKNQLNQFTRSKDTWGMQLQLIPLEKQVVELDCDITIEFQPKPPNKEDEFEFAGYTTKKDLNDIRIVIFFLNIELERVDYTKPADQPGYYYSVVEWIPSYGNYLAPETPLKMTIKHELGHALGLGHYLSYDEERIQQWYDGVQRPPSIMIPTKPTKVISASITQLDVENIVQIYGRDGFFSEEANSLTRSDIVLPDWIKNNAKWWSEGIISDKDFATGIEFMIKNGVIDVGTTGSNNFTTEQKIPDWVKFNAKWWSEGLISSEEFVKGLQFLVQNGIIKV